MPRVARIVAEGVPHHVTQRGNNRQDVFFVDDDRRVYLELLAGQAERFGLDVHAYCLMTNHMHLIVTPRRADSLAKALGRAHWRYTQYINRLHGRGGHLWQNRFFSCPLDAAGAWTGMRYVERNPVRSHLVRQAWRYEWSSAGCHCGVAAPPEWLEMALWRDVAGGSDWQEALTAAEDEAEIAPLRRCTHTGRPLGSDSFLARLETLLGRRVRALPVGRPTGKPDKAKERRHRRSDSKNAGEKRHK